MIGSRPSIPADTEPDPLKQAVEAAGMHAWQWDVDTGRAVLSPGAAELLGVDPGTFDGTFESYVTSLPPDERALVTAAIRRSLDGEPSRYSVEHRVPLPDGRVRWIAAQGDVFRDASGRPARMAGVVWDITARKDAEARLLELSRLSAVASAINRQVLHVTSDRELFETACRIVVELGRFRLAWVGVRTSDGEHLEPAAHYGHEAGYLAGLRVDLRDGLGPAATAVREGSCIVCSDNDPRVRPWRDAALERGYQSGGAFPLRRGGRVVGALSVYSERPGFADQEQIDLVQGLADDLSYALDVLDREERRRAAEEAVRLSELRHRMRVEQASDGIVMIDANRRFVDANEAACRITGRPREELLTLRVEDVIDPSSLVGDPLRFARIPVGGVMLTDRRIVRADGSLVDVEVSTKAFDDGRFQSVMRDVTERKTMQAQLLLADRMASLGRLASGVAHEINNPLAYVMLNLEIVAKGLADIAGAAPPETFERISHALADSREGAERVRRIVRTLSAFGRGDEERVGPVDVNAVLDSAAEMAAMQLRHHARVIKQYEADLPARANPYRLGQVFVNLLVNAADALSVDGVTNEIRLRTYTRRDESIVVEVTDNGVGIPREIQPRIFDPFFTTKPIGRGTGLGLSVCHGIISSFGGQIVCESAEGLGTTFRVVLPAAGFVSAAPAPAESPRDARVKGRVLVVDDDPRVASAVAGALDGAEIVVVTSGREAIDRIRAEPFDCVVCDVVMPEVTGIDVYEALARDGRSAEARIVFVTGGAINDAASEQLRRLTNTVLEKPVDAGELRAAVARVVERGRESPP